MRRLTIVFLLALPGVPALARRVPTLCGTSVETANERLFLHRQVLRKGLRPRLLASPAANRDSGNIAIVEDTDGIVARQNEFNLDFQTLRFSPGYRYSVVDGGYDETAAIAGEPLAALDDDEHGRREPGGRSVA